MEVLNPKKDIVNWRERATQQAKLEPVPHERWIAPVNRMFEEELISVVKGGKTYGPVEHRVHTQAEFDQAVSAHKHIYTEEEIVQRVEERNLLEWIKQGVEHMRVHYYGVAGRPWTPETSVWNVHWIKLNNQKEPQESRDGRIHRNRGRDDDYQEIWRGSMHSDAIAYPH